MAGIINKIASVSFFGMMLSLAHEVINEKACNQVGNVFYDSFGQTMQTNADRFREGVESLIEPQGDDTKETLRQRERTAMDLLLGYNRAASEMQANGLNAMREAAHDCRERGALATFRRAVAGMRSEFRYSEGIVLQPNLTDGRDDPFQGSPVPVVPQTYQPAMPGPRDI